MFQMKLKNKSLCSLQKVNILLILSQPPQGREIIRSERTPEERNGEINQEEANKPSQT